MARESGNLHFFAKERSSGVFFEKRKNAAWTVISDRCGEQRRDARVGSPIGKINNCRGQVLLAEVILRERTEVATE
jgi:hypothetical protein